MTFIDKDFALFYGIMLGDGCLSLVYGRKKFISITGSSDDDLPFFREVLHPLLKKFRGKDTKIKFKKNYRAIEFNFTDKNLFDIMESVGFQVGKKGPNIKIPEIFYKKGLVKYVVQGFFATDGSLVLTKNPNKYYPRIESQAICKNLLKQIHNYLSTIGMNGKFYKKTFRLDPRWKIQQDRYSFQFNGKENLLLFEKLIGFSNPKHNKRFEGFIEYSDDYDTSLEKVRKRISSRKYNEINSNFESLMAPGRFELPISAS